MSRLEKRKELKKLKRKQQRLQAALLSAQQEEVEVDEEALIRQEQEEKEALAKEQAEHEEQERLWSLREEEARIEWIRKQEEEAERKRKEEERRLQGEGGEDDLEEGWEYVEDGPAEIIWQGNEIIVKKPRKKVRKGTHSGTPLAIEDKKRDGPISNPLPPQNVAFSSYQTNTQDIDLSTNFGTEKDQRNCPFYIKTGVCRFGVRCNRLHPVFNEACTLLMRSMYTGAGLALEPVESLEVCAGIIPQGTNVSSHKLTSRRGDRMLRWQRETEAAIYTDEEVVQDYEEFYGDVHSEFIQFGEIVNFKVCRNSSPHLRGNVYVHYVSQESAMAAYNHMNGRFYAKKQISCEFVGVHKWKLAICGEFMRTNFKTCSRGTVCNFLHCFENPHREYEWADTDRPAPRFWQRKMAKFFGYAHVSDEEVDERSRTRRESTHDTDHRGRHRDDRELVYDNDRKRDRRMRDSAREDDQRSGRDDRERKYYYEDEMKDRTRRGSSKYNDRHRGRHSIEKSYDGQREKHERDAIYDDDSARHSKEKSYDNRRREKSGRDSIYDDDSARISMHGGEPGCINDERWIAGDDNPEIDDVVHHRNRRERHHRSTTNDEHDDDDDAGHPGRHSPTSDRVGHHRSHRHRSRRRSRSPSSHRTRKSRSQDRSTSHRARSQDGHYSSSEEQEDKYLKQTRHRTERASKESKRRRHSAKGTGHDIHDTQLASDMLERRGDEVVGKSYSSEDHPESEHHQKASRMVDIRSKDVEDTVAGMASDGHASGSTLLKLEIQSGLLDVGNLDQDTNSSSSSNTGISLSLDLSTDHVQKSTSEWQSWRKTKKVKLGLKEKPMRVII